MPSTLTLNGAAITPYIPAVAQLRIAVFREFPYLYDGDLAYERDYLSHYAASPDSVVVLALESDEVVGASTGLPLEDADSEFQIPFADTAPAASDVFYLGESVLLPAFRGHGIGHAFFDARETHARSLSRFTHTAFCAVDRSPTVPEDLPPTGNSPPSGPSAVTPATPP